MMRSCCALLLVATAAAAEPSPLQEARQRWLRGNYDEAREQYEPLLKNDKLRNDAAIGLSRALQSVGEYDKALSVVEDAVKDSPKHPALLARQAELLYFRGRWDDAEKTADAAVALDGNNFLARWIQAQIRRDRGDVKKADTDCRWFVRTYTERSNQEKDIKDPEELLLVGLAGSEYARWNHLSDQFEFILTEVYADALKGDKDFWLAEYEAGMLLMEKYNKPEALEAFGKAEKINPSAAEVLVGKGILALREYKIQDAERFAERALKINPKLPAALRLRADVHLAVGDTAAALRELETARTVNDRDEQTLGRIAACLRLQHKKTDDLEAKVAKLDSKPAVFWFVLGEALEDCRHYDDAKECFVTADKQRPNLSGPASSLGMLYMRLGQEKEASEMLDRGFKADQFNVRVNNSRKVLHHLQKYKTIETDHFTLRYDPKNDEVLAKWMIPYLEEIHRDLCAKFAFTPKERILVEVFNKHEMFSGRVVALPDLHTIGACTGRMIAMDSPYAEGIPKRFNWLRVLRHEIVHVFNLEQTRFQVKHWLTEGLAVGNEGFPRPGMWNDLLRERVPAGKLMNLDNIDLGFIRPSNQEEWHMAYCQSQLYVEYLKKTYGDKVIGELLDAYKDGLTTTEVVQKVCKTDKGTVEKGYREYVAEVVKGLQAGKPPEKPRSMKDLKAAFEKDNDLDAGAEMALRLLESGDKKQARHLAEEVLKTKKDHARANYVMARLAHEAGDEKEERARLEGIADKAAEPLVLETLGKIYYEAEEFEKAAEIYEQARKAEPTKGKWLAQLVRVYAQMNNKTKLIAVLEELVPQDADEFDMRLRLAKLLLETGKADRAEAVARQALEIDVRNAEARDVLVEALRKQKKDAEAEKVEEVLGKKS
jgi:tetratricopeptide (TPR) repeat protein